MVAVMAEWRHMGETARFQETLRKLSMIDEAFVGDETGLGLGPAGTTGPGRQDRLAAAVSRVGGHRVTGVLPGMGPPRGPWPPRWR